MKFMKLGSKPDAFQSNGDNIRYVATELSSDLVVNVIDIKFYLHKFPLLSKSARLQKLVDIATEEGKDEIYIEDIPGGPAAFEICAKYCYGMTVTLNAYNVVAARCAAEYLEMHETVEKGNLVYKIEVFLNSSLFRGWKDSIIVLQSTTKSLLQWSKELKLISHCVEALALMASIDSSKVEWSYTYNRKKLPSENGLRMEQHSVPKDWWVEDLCDLDLELYKRVVSSIKTKNRVSNEVIGEALKAYLLRRLPGFSKGAVQGGDTVKNQSLVSNVVQLLPREKGSVSCGFLLRLLRAALVLECKDSVRKELIGRIAWQLDEASVADLLIRVPSGGDGYTVYDVELVLEIVKEFVSRVQNEHESEESEMSNGMVAKLVDCYLAEVSRDPNLPMPVFFSLAELVSGFPRPSHDGLYRAIDMFLKEHPGISKSEKKRICRLMDCRKLSAEASTHAVQNERLPLRVVVQVLFFEQARGGASLPSGGSHSSSRSATTNTEEDLDTVEELKALKGELVGLRLGPAKAPRNEAKGSGLVVSKRLVSKLVRDGENSSSE